MNEIIILPKDVSLFSYWICWEKNIIFYKVKSLISDLVIIRISSMNRANNLKLLVWHFKSERINT